MAKKIIILTKINNEMSKQKAYRNAQALLNDLGKKSKIKWIGSIAEQWVKEEKLLQKEVVNRDKNFNQAVKISKENNEPLSRPETKYGTDYNTWRKEVRRLQMRLRRKPAKEAKEQAKKQAKEEEEKRKEQAKEEEEKRKAKQAKEEQAIWFNKMIKDKNFNAIVEDVLRGNRLTEQQAFRLYNTIITEGRYNILIKRYGEIYTEKYKGLNMPVNETTKMWFFNFLIVGDLLEEKYMEGSDRMTLIYIEEIEKILIEKYEKPNRVMKNRDGKFFPYINTSEIDLSKYQIFNQKQAYNKKLINYREHCLLHTFLECGVSPAVVNQIKLSYVEGHHIRKKDIKKLGEMLKHNIYIHTMKPCGKIDVNKIIYDKESKAPQDVTIPSGSPTIHMAVYESHYFLFEKLIIEGRKTNSLLLVNKMFNEGCFKKLDFTLFAEANSTKETKEHIYLDNIENEQTPMLSDEDKLRIAEYKKSLPDNARKIKPLKRIIKPEIYYADCESFVNGKLHDLYMIGFVSDKNDCVSLLSVCDNIYKSNENVSKKQLLVNSFLNGITKGGKHPALCYFHNLKYDYHLIEPFLNLRDRCEKDNQIYSVKIFYKEQEVELRDSFKLIPFALSKFQKEFNLPEEYGKKEAISYTYYTEENDSKTIPIRLYEKLLNTKEQKIFREQIKSEPTYDADNKTFNPTEYYKDYLRLDCLVLKKGLQKFNELIGEITEGKMSIYECLTISSLTDKYMIKEGAYNNIWNVTGNLRAYIAKAVYGGRVNVNSKYKKQVINGKIADYDGVSLYPSAIHRLCREMGLPQGKATRFARTEIGRNWEKKDYAIMTVKITKVNKHQEMPFIANKTKDSIEYQNTPPENEIVIDSITLQDYIKFHEIEYEILDGVYWNSGYNRKMGDVVLRLFNARMKYKNTNTALATVIKLMLNSSYGKTITKKTQTEMKIVRTNYKTFNKKTETWNKVDRTPFKDYVYNNFHTIKAWRQINENCYEVERVCSDRSSNRGHIGCAILSMSKRIMNEVFDVANDNKLPIYYTDTDSIHMNCADVDKLETEYKVKYNKVLNGKNLEQFHTDFNLNGAVGEIYSKTSIFLGKKSYLDVLESKDKDGNIINDYHIRLKGITEAGLLDASKKYTDSYLGLYSDLAKGTKISFVLNPFNVEENHQKVMFEFVDGAVKTRKEFVREVKF